MQNIIYKSENLIPWDTQSAFKMTSYRATREENMVFCYLKAYVHHNDLVLCSYCFTERPCGKNNLQLFINLNPEKSVKPLKIDFGYEGIRCAVADGMDFSDRIEYHPFKSDDEQGFYWCGEIHLNKELISRISGAVLREKSLITMNMVQRFDNGDLSALFGDVSEKNYSPVENMEVFVILDY